MPSDPELIARVLWFAAGIAALIGALAILQSAFVEMFRQRVFALRRELFLVMASGAIKPTDPAYTRIRNAMNGLLRYAHRLTLGRAIVSWFAHRDSLPDGIATAIKRTPDEATRKKLETLYQRLLIELLRHILMLSPAAWALAILGFAVVAVVVAVMVARVGFRLLLVATRVRVARLSVVRYVVDESEALGEAYQAGRVGSRAGAA